MYKSVLLLLSHHKIRIMDLFSLHILQSDWSRLVFVFFKCLFNFLAALGLRCCVRAFSSCGEQGLLSVAVRGLFIAVASLSCRAQALGVQASVVVARGL